MALHLIARTVDADTAAQLARVMEYTRHDDPDDDPFAR